MTAAQIAVGAVIVVVLIAWLGWLTLDLAPLRDLIDRASDDADQAIRRTDAFDRDLTAAWAWLHAHPEVHRPDPLTDTVPEARALGQIDDVELARALAHIEDDMRQWLAGLDAEPAREAARTARKRTNTRRAGTDTPSAAERR